MTSIKTRARRAGVLYVLLAIIAPFNLMYVPRTFIVVGDAAATTANIAAGELVYRVGIFGGLTASIIFLFVGLSLYDLFKNVNRRHARLMVMLVAVGATVGVVNLINQIGPLVLASDAHFSSAFTKPQLDALALGFLGLRSHLTEVEMVFWGLWLFPFGILVITSGFFPRLLGILLLITGCAYVISSFTGVVLPDYARVVSRIMMPLYVGELPIVIWLVVKGARVPEVGHLTRVDE